MKRPTLLLISHLVLNIDLVTSSFLQPHSRRLNTPLSMKQDGQETNRRVFVTSSLLFISTTTTTANASTDPLFRPNPLTNPVLEKIRILDQEAADSFNYKELASPQKREQTYAKLLLPILIIEADIQTLDTLLVQTQPPDLKQAQQILSRSYYAKLQFKKLFNAFADNIYYSDPDRANAYLGGGAIPKNEQSIAYLLRNDMLTNFENLQAEVNYLLSSKETDYKDMIEYVQIIRDDMKQYLDLVPPSELNEARNLYNSKR